MADLFKLVFLQTVGPEVQAFFADLPTAVESAALVFQGPITIPLPKEASPQAYANAVPVFDDRNTQIIWAYHAKPQEPLEDVRLQMFDGIKVLRIGSHFILASVENVSAIIHKFLPLSVMLEGEAVSVGGPMREAWQGGESGFQIGIRKKLDEGLWKALPCNTPSKTNLDIIESNLFCGTDSSMKYVYNLSTPSAGDRPRRTINLDIIKASQYRELASNSSLLWQHFDIEVERADIVLATLITHDQDTGKHKLYIFGRGRSSVLVRYISLRKDGSVDSYNTKMKPHGEYAIPHSDESSWDRMHAFIYDDKVILTGHAESTTAGKIGTVARDGSITGADGWKDIQFTWNEDLAGPSGMGLSSMSGLLVPNEFFD